MVLATHLPLFILERGSSSNHDVKVLQANIDLGPFDTVALTRTARDNDISLPASEELKPEALNAAHRAGLDEGQ